MDKEKIITSIPRILWLHINRVFIDPGKEIGKFFCNVAITNIVFMLVFWVLYYAVMFLLIIYGTLNPIVQNKPDVIVVLLKSAPALGAIVAFGIYVYICFEEQYDPLQFIKFKEEKSKAK